MTDGTTVRVRQDIYERLSEAADHPDLSRTKIANLAIDRLLRSGDLEDLLEIIEDARQRAAEQDGIDPSLL